jgi:hypothetical protein
MSLIPPPKGVSRIYFPIPMPTLAIIDLFVDSINQTKGIMINPNKLCLIALLIIRNSAVVQLHGDLKFGQFEVGFKIINEKDIHGTVPGLPGSEGVTQN